MSDYVKSPALKDLLANFFAMRPKDVDGVMNRSSMYYHDKLLRIVLGRFTIDGWPEEWDIDYALTHLFLDGYFCITDTDAGLLPLKCGVAGHNVWNRPNRIIVANPIVGSFERTIGVDGALIRLQYNYRGIETMLQRYATLLSMCDSSEAVNLLNAKVAFVAFAETKAQAETMKKMYDAIAMGEPAVFLRGDPTARDSFMFNNAKQNFVGGEVHDLKDRIIDEFFSELGIKNTNTEKKERLVTAEATSRNEEIKVNTEHWLETVQKGLDDANRLFDLSLTFKMKELTAPAQEEEWGDADGR